MPAVLELTLNFGSNGNSLGYLGGGWARAEETFTWAVGQESHLLLNMGQEGREYVLLLNVVPFARPPGLTAQRLIVSMNETVIGAETVTRPAMLAWRIPPGIARRAERTLVTLSHPDAARPADLGDSTDDRQLAFAVSEARLYHLPRAAFADQPLPAGLSLGSTAAPGFAVHPGADLGEWALARTGLPLAELATRFESLGDNCEFGLVQRRCDTEPLGLLRFAGAFSHDIVRGIERGFEGIGDPADIEPRLEGDDAGKREFMIHERKYGLIYHTFVYEGQRDPELLRRQEGTRLQFLRRKFLEEIDAGEKIFVYRAGGDVPEAEILSLFLALNRGGRNTLLWVAPERGGRPCGTVEVLMNGLLKGHIDRFAPGSNAHDFSFEGWITVCVNAFLLDRLLRAAAA